MDPKQADRLLMQSYLTTQKLQTELEKLPVLLDELRRNSGVCTKEAENMVHATLAAGDLFRRKALDAQAGILLDTEKLIMPLVYGPNPRFDNT